MTSPTATNGPPPGTRPRNRRELIREAAASLFAEHGYRQVSLSDVAAAVNVGQSALYRHHSDKAGLLYDTISTQLSQVAAQLLAEAAPDLPGMADALARAVLDHRHAGVLWQREARNLGAADRARLRKIVSAVNRWLGDALRTGRPELNSDQAELLASCTIDAAMSISFHRTSLPRAAFETLLGDLCLRVLRLSPPTSDAAGDALPPPRHTRPASRSDTIVDAAIGLFAERGYPAVSVDDIGEAVGIAGPSIYNHFESKQAILIAAMDRGNARLLADLDQSRPTDSSNEDALRRISDTYVTITLDDSDLVATLIGETIHLGEADRKRIREIQRRFVDHWVTSLRAYHPNDSPLAARIKVQAAQMVANDIARTRHLRKVPGFREAVREVCWAVQQ